MPEVELGASSRSLIHLMSATKACARLNGRAHVTIADVREMAPFVLRHRLMVREGTTQEDALRQALDSVPAPVETPGV
jgi:MoxR-like ATPase